MRTIKLISASLLALALSLSASCGHATGDGSDSLTRIAVQQNFALTDDLLARYEAAHADIHASPCTPRARASRNGQTMSFDELAARYEAQPATHTILTRHGITAKDYLLAQAVLGAARLKYGHEMMEKANPQAANSIKTPTPVVSDDNYAFFVAHRDQIRQATLHEMRSRSSTRAAGNAACTS